MPTLLPIVVGIVLAQEPAIIQDAPRLRTILKSGAVTLVERMPEADVCSVQLWATGRECAETPETHGRRHLLEHLVVKGRNRDLDRRLEARGMYLTASTFRDAMKIEITCAPKDVAFATRAIYEILQPFQTSPEEIAKEARILEQEFALMTPAQSLAAIAWTQAYGDHGLDSMGDLDVIRETKPDQLARLHESQFDRRGLTLIIAGPVPLAETSVYARDALGEEIGPKKPDEPGRPQGEPGVVKTDLAGEARAALIPGIGDERALPILAAGMAIASQYDLEIFYTPTAQNGLVVLTSTQPGSITKCIDDLSDAEARSLFNAGIALVSSWLHADGTPSRVASLRGGLMTHRVDLRPERLQESVDRMTVEQFMRGFEAYKVGKAVVVEGGGAAPEAGLRSTPAKGPTVEAAPPTSQPTVINVIESPIPSSEQVVVAAFIRAPGLSGKDRAAFAILGEALLEGTQEFTRRQLLDYGSQAGVPPLVEVLPDLMCIRIVMPKDGLGVAVGLMDALVRRPSLRAEDIQRLLTRRQSRTPSVWAQALDPSMPDFARVKTADVRELHQRLFRPENMWFSAGGGFAAGSGESALKLAFGDWKTRKVANPAPDPPAKPLWLRRPHVATYELRLAPRRPSDERFAARTLATFALGVGKAGAMNRILREEQAWSYRQEAILWPTLEGWETRLVTAQTAGEDQPQMPERIRKALLEDVATWSEETRTRALAMAEAAFARTLEVNPFWSGPRGPMPAGSEGATLWAGYSALLGSPSYTQAMLLESMRQMDLGDLKTAALEMLAEARGVIVYGGKLPDLPDEPDGG